MPRLGARVARARGRRGRWCRVRVARWGREKRRRGWSAPLSAAAGRASRGLTERGEVARALLVDAVGSRPLLLVDLERAKRWRGTRTSSRRAVECTRLGLVLALRGVLRANAHGGRLGGRWLECSAGERAMAGAARSAKAAGVGPSQAARRGGTPHRCLVALQRPTEGRARRQLGRRWTVVASGGPRRPSPCPRGSRRRGEGGGRKRGDEARAVDRRRRAGRGGGDRGERRDNSPARAEFSDGVMQWARSPGRHREGGSRDELAQRQLAGASVSC